MTIVPSHWYSSGFSVVNHDRTLATVDISSWRERGDITVGDVTHHVYREHVCSGDFIIERAGTVLARASKPSSLTSTVVLHYNGRDYTLRKASIWRREFVIEDDERQIGSIAPTSMWSRRAVADLPDEWPEAIKFFTMWLAMIMWRREQAAA